MDVAGGVVGVVWMCGQVIVQSGPPGCTCTPVSLCLLSVWFCDHRSL